MEKSNHQVETSVSSYDKLSGALTAAILIFGFLVSVMFLIWLTSVFDFSGVAPPEIVTKMEAGNEKPEGFEDDVLEPGVEEFPEVETPQLKDALEAVTDAVSSVKAALEKRDGDAAQIGAGAGYGSREGGPGTGDANIVPESKRWKIEYESDDIEKYADQLDKLNLTLGVVSLSSNEIILVTNLSTNPQAKTSSRKDQSRTLRFEHKRQRLRRWDVTLAKRSGVSMDDRVVVQFYPENTRQMIRVVEATYLATAGRDLEEVRQTLLKVVRNGNRYEFVVTDVLYR